MARFGPTFPAFDVWQKMSESEQDPLLASMERSRRRSGLVGILIALLLMADDRWRALSGVASPIIG